jgi:hypothetical protein
MLDEVMNKLNDENISFKRSDDDEEIVIVVGYSNDDEVDEDLLDELPDASEVEAILDSMIDDGENVSYYYDSYERADGVTVETINVSGE